MRGTLFWLLLWLLAVTVFAWSNQATTVTVKFWQWPVAEGPLGMLLIGAGVLGALLTYVTSFAHHVRQARQIRSLEETIRANESRQSAPPLAARPPGSVEETRRLS